MATFRASTLVGTLLVVGACSSMGGAWDSSTIPPTATMSGKTPSASTDNPSAWVKSREQMEREQRMASVDIGPATDRARSVIAASVGAATSRTAGWRESLPDQPNYETILSRDRDYQTPVSLGTVSRGRIEHAVSLPAEGPHHAIIERHRKRNTNWGTPEIVGALKTAAAEVAEVYPDSTLKVGNIGYRHGGDIPWSSSHNSGRDADLAFYVRRTDDGTRVPAPALVAFDSQGRATGDRDLEFDVERNWILVRSLLTNPEVGLQWLFISEPLKQKLLAHARDVGEPPRVIRRAKHVLHQPTDAPPHNDHLHLRITCPQRDRVEGCLDYGPRWVWVDWHDRALLARTLALREALADPDPEVRRRALSELERIRSPYAPEVALAEGVDDDHPRVRAEALDVATEIPSWSQAAIAAAIQFIERPSTPVSERREAYEILRRDHSRRARRFAFSRLMDETVSDREKRYAARALHHVVEPGLVPSLIEELDRQPPAVRHEIAKVVRRMTGHSEGIHWKAVSGARAADAKRRWRQWWESHRHKSREE